MTSKSNQPDDYDKFAEQASELFTGTTVGKRLLKRSKRITGLGLAGLELYHDTQRLFEKILRSLGPQAAVDMFEQALDGHRLKQPGTWKKKKGVAHSEWLDVSLLEMFDENNPESPYSRARKGTLPGYLKPLTKEKFAQLFVGKDKPWGFSSAQHALRRLKYLKSKPHT